MNNINQYKKRFYTLMESTIGDVKPLISEQPRYCATKLFKQSTIDTQGMEGLEDVGQIAVLKVLIGAPGTKFKVIRTYGGPELNRKSAESGMIITPDTTITLCNTDYIHLSGMGYPEAELYYDEGKIMFKKQYA